ncbi:MAG: family 16 glycoside hydrolase, partial [Planctomycetota bacterium]
MNRAMILLSIFVIVNSTSAPLHAGEFPAGAFGGKVEILDDGYVAFSYDFDDPGELRDWAGVGRDEDAGTHAWAADGVLEIRKTSKDFAFAYLKPVFTGNITIIAKARLTPPNDKELLFRLYGPSNKEGYRIAMAYPMAGEMGSYIYKFPGEVLKKVQKPELVPGKWYEIRVRVKEKSITVHLKKSLILRVTDDEHRKGQVGFGTFASNVGFDSIRIEGKVDPDWLQAHTSGRSPASGMGELSAPGEDDLLSGVPREVVESIRKGKEWYGMGDFDAAAKSFREAAQADRSNPLPLFFEGMTLLAQGQPREAETLFGRAATVRRDLPWIHLWRSRARRLAGGGSETSLDGAVDDLRQAIETDGRYFEAFRELATIYFGRKQFDEAVAASQKCLRLLSALQTEASGEAAGKYAKAREEAEKERDRYAWARDGLPLRPAREAAIPFGKVRTDGSVDDLQEIARWVGSVSNGFRMITGRPGVKGAVVYLVKSRSVFQTYRFPGTSVEKECGTYNPPTRDVVLYHGAGRKAWCAAAAELCARFLARDAGAAPWVEEGLARYFSTIPSDGDDRLKAGQVHKPSADKIRLAVSAGNFTSLSRFVTLDREAFL